MAPTKALVLKNIDGSKRCLDTLSHRAIKAGANAAIKFGVHGQASRITTEIIKILFEEILLKNVHVKSVESRVDLISGIEDGQIDYSIVDLDRDNNAAHTTYKLGMVGFQSQSGWYVNKASLRPGFALTSYASFALDGMIDAMNNISLPSNMTIERCYDNFLCKSKPCQDINLCNQSTGIFENPVCRQHGSIKIKCATIYAGIIDFAPNIIQKQSLFFDLPLKVIWLGTENLKKFVTENINSKVPLIFHWWEPNLFSGA